MIFAQFPEEFSLRGSFLATRWFYPSGLEIKILRRNISTGKTPPT
jgi:hypothetical protein